MSRKSTTSTRGRGMSTFIVRATVATMLCLLGAIPAFAEDVVQHQFTIPTQSLRTALQEFAKQSGIDVVLSVQVKTDYVAPVLNGRYSSASALQVLLNGSGLISRQLDDRTIEVQPASGQFVRTADVQGQIPADSAPLLAQNNAAAQTPSAPAAPEGPLPEVIVTGSRIARQDYTSLSPIVTVDTPTLENRSDIGIESALNQLPQFNVAGSSSALSEASSPFPNVTAAPGAATLDLRGLGINRTLVLVDGMRAQPVNALLAIDLNTIPAEAVASIETITGGAAATYGADAISGVVNFKLKQNFQGVEIDAQQGISQAGDDKETTISALIGGNFADNKGNLMVVLNYAKRGEIQGDNHAWVRAGWNDPNTQGGALGSSNLSEYAYPGPPFFTNSPTGPGVYGPPASGTWIDQNGHLFDQNAPLATGYSGPLGGTSGYKINPNGSLGYNNEQFDELGIPLTRYSVLLTGHYNFNDHVSAFTEANFTNTNAQTAGFFSELYNIWQVTIPYNPAYDDPASPTFENGPAGTSYHPVPAALATVLNSRPTPNAPWVYNGGTDYFGPYTTDTTTNVFQITTGLRGDVPGTDWTWEVYGQHGQSNVLDALGGFPNVSRIQTLFNASNYGLGFNNITPGAIAIAGSCTSGLPIFNTNGSVNNTASASQDCDNFADPTLNNVTVLTQNVYEGDIQGALFDMPFSAGKLRYALGADFRSEALDFTPDSGFTADQATPNIDQNIGLPVPVSGHTGVAEIYTEFAIPVLKDLPLAKAVEIDPGIRFSHYNSDEPGVANASGGGGVTTWKLLTNWAVTDWVKFRGGLEVANRAPNVAELFSPTSTVLDFGFDPCASYVGTTPSWGNSPSNPNRYNLQAACQYLIERDAGAGAAIAGSYMVPGASANNYQYAPIGPDSTAFPFPLAIVTGNPELKSETARTITAGFVLSSPFSNPYVQRLRMSVDWYQIQLNNAIGTLTFGAVYQQCLDAQYNNLIASAPGTYTGAQLVANNPNCAYIQREYAPAVGDPYGALRSFLSPYINEGGIQSRGIDSEVDWGVRFGDTDLLKSLPGGFTVNIVATYLDRYAVSPFAGAAYVNYVGTVTNDSYRYRVLSTFGYTIGPASVGFRWQHLPGTRADPSAAPDTQGAANAYNEVDLFARYTLTDAIELRAGINNLINAWPVWVGANPSNAEVGNTNANYDTTGRRFYLGVKAKF
jgi:iron complex outermembrane recepter protein